MILYVFLKISFMRYKNNFYWLFDYEKKEKEIE
jgi:hypothetical protein